MASRFGPLPTQNNNNHLTDRSSTRCAKPPGGGSTMGSILFGDNAHAQSFMDERKTRKLAAPTPEHNPIGDKDSFYGQSTASQRERERVTAAPGAVPRDALVVATPPALARHGSSNNNMAECLAGSGADNNDGQRRTRRMFGPPGGVSSFKLGSKLAKCTLFHAISMIYISSVGRHVRLFLQVAGFDDSAGQFALLIPDVSIMGAAESKVAAQPLAVVATATGSAADRLPPPSSSSRPSASGWTCKLLRKQNKTAPANTSATNASTPLQSSPTIEALKVSKEPTVSLVAHGPRAHLVTTNKTDQLEQLSFEELSTQLLKAVKNGDQQLVEHVVETARTKSWAILNIRGMWESTPLLYACQYCHEPIALWLVQQGANVHLANEKGVSPLLLASLEGMATATQQILERLAVSPAENPLPIDLQIGVVYNSAVDMNVRVNPLLAASMNGHDTVVTLLLRHGASVNHGVAPMSANSNNKSSGSRGGASAGRGVLQFPLLAAAKYGHASVATLLLEHHAECGELDGLENHALLLACEAAKEDCALALMQAPVDRIVWKRTNAHGFTALHCCAVHGLAKAAEFMLRDLGWAEDPAFLDATSATRQESAVLMAARKKHTDVVKLLLERGADAMLPDRGATTAMDVLKRDKRDELVQLWDELQAKKTQEGGASGRKSKQQSGHDLPVQDDCASPNEPVKPLAREFSTTTSTTPVPEKEVTPAKPPLVLSTQENVSCFESRATDTNASPSPDDVIDQPLLPVVGGDAASYPTADGATQNDLIDEVSESQQRIEATVIIDATSDPVEEPAEEGCFDETLDFAPLAPQKARGNRSKSTDARNKEARRATGFAVDLTAKAKSLSSLSNFVAAQEVDEEGEEEGQSEDPNRNTQEIHAGALGVPPKSVESVSDAASASPTIPNDKPKRKKRPAKKKAGRTVTSSRKKEDATTRAPDAEEPSLQPPSLCIPERSAPEGNLDDDF